jgi:ATP/maltotriose-dependent transcriptional regulator MalT
MALTARTEGWAAGLQLAALSLRGRTDAAGFVAAFSGSHRFVLDYLADEVLDGQPGQVRATSTPITWLGSCASAVRQALRRHRGERPPRYRAWLSR